MKKHQGGVSEGQETRESHGRIKEEQKRRKSLEKAGNEEVSEKSKK